MGRKFRDMESPEVTHQRAQAAAAAQRARQAAAEHDAQAAKDDNAIWAIGREGRRGYDPEAAASFLASRNRNLDRANQLDAEAARHEAAAKAPAPKKKGWWR
ncbi:hypothetical protein ACIO6U_02755 [Streptomyces sp. NPDC087422]|uniref:hypothetical protein n=1 Tax=Streptomyces sp. NPDC087422 TaxID=3365786 RepID=UPI00382C0A4A